MTAAVLPALATLATLTMMAALPFGQGGGQALAAGRAPGIESEVIRLVPHRALYRMTLKTANSGSGLAAAKGAMQYRFTETCDAWTVGTNIFLRLHYAETGDVDIAWSFAAVETKDGLGYRFRMTHKRQGRLVESLKGTAAIASAGGAGEARFEAPFESSGGEDGKTAATVALPKGTLFPTAHLKAMIEAGRKGTRFFAETVFDGASLKNPYRVSAAIGNSRAPLSGDTLALFRAAGLEQAAAWPVRLAFFPVRSRQPEPEFELGIDYRADGVAERITQDYGAFTIAMRPDEIEVLDRPDC